DYLLNGGRAIVNTFYTALLPNHPIWSLIGVNVTASWLGDSNTTIWDTDHDIFETPIDYSAATLNISNANFGTDGSMVEVFGNATALAGFTSTEQEGNASIVLRNDGNVILNSVLLNNYRGDIDESGYLDTLELWFNQIAYMLGLAGIDHPADITYESGSTGNTITWIPADSAPATYAIYVDWVQDTSGSWDGSAITYNADGLSLGVHTVECSVVGDSGNPRGDIVLITVVDTLNPLINSPPDVNMVLNSTGNTLTWITSDPNPDHFVITMNTSAWSSGVWDGSNVVLNLDGLTEGVYFFTIRVNDTLGHYSEDTVLVTVTPGGFFGLDTITLILIGVGILALIIIAVVCSKRRGSQAPAPKPRAKKNK
ncbi:MAG: hypothetical protein P1Q69_16740, partial [Candidatus Thorarchaeota archaeon]|nr:hypothetical protein [Candidatus Thorarchaeota archaeon]